MLKKVSPPRYTSDLVEDPTYSKSTTNPLSHIESLLRYWLRSLQFRVATQENKGSLPVIVVSPPEQQISQGLKEVSLHSHLSYCHTIKTMSWPDQQGDAGKTERRQTLRWQITLWRWLHRYPVCPLQLIQTYRLRRVRLYEIDSSGRGKCIAALYWARIAAENGNVNIWRHWWPRPRKAVPIWLYKKGHILKIWTFIWR